MENKAHPVLFKQNKLMVSIALNGTTINEIGLGVQYTEPTGTSMFFPKKIISAP